jgi:uncharacterized protein YjbI with pentapeptide repeats
MADISNNESTTDISNNESTTYYYAYPPPYTTTDTTENINVIPDVPRLILIDSRIKDIDVIINATNSKTYCLVFNYFHDTQDTILSKLRFLNENNQYILDNFYYEEPIPPTQMDGSGNHCTPCDGFDMSSFQLLPSTLYAEHLEYVMNNPEQDISSGNTDISGDATSSSCWTFYPESTNIRKTPVFFQRAKIQNIESAPEAEPEAVDSSANDITNTSTEENQINSSNTYVVRPLLYINYLDELYDLFKDTKEASSSPMVFDSVCIMQHSNIEDYGYKLIHSEPINSVVKDVIETDPNLQSWSSFVTFILNLKTIYGITTLDLVACALYANPNWRYIIDTISSQQNIIIRASNDNTGTSLGGGDWVLETNDINLTNVYFTTEIYNWKYILDTYIDNRIYFLRYNNAMYSTRAYNNLLRIADGTKNFTIETWYYETARQTSSTILDMGIYDYTFQIRNVYAAGNDTTGLSFYNSGVPGNVWMVAETAVVPVAQWSHIALTREGSTMTFYINGVARHTRTDITGNFSSSTDGIFGIGVQAPGPGATACNCNLMKDGNVLYDLRLWSVARSASQIRMNRNRILPANTSGLVANYLFNESSGSTFQDRTSNGFNTAIVSYNSARRSNTLVSIPNIGILINNGYSLTTYNSTNLNAVSHFGDITYTDFSGVDFSGVDLVLSDLRGSNLTNANFTNANLWGAIAYDANITGINLSYANITGVNFRTLTTKSLQFDGVDDYVTLGIPTWANESQFRNTMTVECWFKTTNTSPQPQQFPTIVARNIGGGQSNSSQFALFMVGTFDQANNGAVGFGVTSGSSNIGLYVISSPLKYNDGKWHHVAGTYTSSGGTASLYVDGVLIKTESNANIGATSATHYTSIPIIIGCDAGELYGYLDRNFQGSISDVRIWNVDRTQTQLWDNYRRRLIGNEDRLMGYWPLNQGYGSGWTVYTSVIDKTVTRQFGTLTNFASPSSSWVDSPDLPFIPTITPGNIQTLINVLLANPNGWFIDPFSNSLGEFVYSVNNSSARITTGAATTKTIYSIQGPITTPVLTTYDFPVLENLSNWSMDISFTVTAGTWYRPLIGSNYNPINTGRGWGLWISQYQGIHWGWSTSASDVPNITVSNTTGVQYALNVTQSNKTTITFTLTQLSNNTTQTGSLNISGTVMGRGPVTIGGWIGWNNQPSPAEGMPGTISSIRVSVPTNQRVIEKLSVSSSTVITASQISLYDFASDSINSNSFTISKSPTILTRVDFNANVTHVIQHLNNTFTVSVTSNRGTAVSYESSDPTVATVGITSGVVTILKSGETTIKAYQLETDTYNYREITSVVTVARGDSGFASSTFTVESSKTFGESPFGITTAPSSISSGAITYTTDASNVATINSSTRVITLVGAGQVTFTATQAETDLYLSATITSNILTVSRGVSGFASSTFTVESSKTFGESPFGITTAPSSPSTGAIIYTTDASNVATINSSSGVITLVGQGTVRFTATQAQTNQYLLATKTSNMLTVARAANTITRGTNFTNATFSRPYDVNSLTFNIAASSSNTTTDIMFTSSDSNTASVARVNATTYTVTIQKVGQVILTASQIETNQYNAPTNVSSAFTISPGTTTLVKQGTHTGATITKMYKDAPFDISANSLSVGLVRYSSNSAIASVNETTGQVTIMGVGTCILTASQDASGNYGVPANITWSLEISKGIPSLVVPATLSYNVTAPEFTITPTSDSSGVITFSLSPSNTTLATLNANTGLVVLKSPGTFTVITTQATNSLFVDISSSTVITVASAGTILEGTTISSSQSYAGVDLSGASLLGTNATNVNFAGANMSNVNFTNATITGANFTNTNINGANITGIVFTALQKLQLLRNTNNRSISSILLTETTGNVILSAIPANTAFAGVTNISSSIFKVILPVTSTNPASVLSNITISDISNSFYLPVNSDEYFQIDNVKYYTTGTMVKKYSNDTEVNIISVNGRYYKLFAGSLAAVLIDLNTYKIRDVGLGEILSNELASTEMYFASPPVSALPNANSHGVSLGPFDWDFQSFEYDIEIDIQQNAGDNTDYYVYWGWNGDATQSFYRQNFIDHIGNGSTSLTTGPSTDSKLIYLYRDANLHHAIRGRLRVPINPNTGSSLYNNRLLFDYNCVQTLQAPNTRAFGGNFKTSRGFSQYIGATTNSNIQFNGSKTIQFWVNVANYFGTNQSSNQISVRILKIPIK